MYSTRSKTEYTHFTVLCVGRKDQTLQHDCSGFKRKCHLLARVNQWLRAMGVRMAVSGSIQLQAGDEADDKEVQ